jgi:hypothetical protein
MGSSVKRMVINESRLLVSEEGLDWSEMRAVENTGK